jgi:response regulator RpfG family c-di-GMP phosphodiesterase
MNGWEFVDELNTVIEDQEVHVTICMLSSSFHPDDTEKFQDRRNVHLYLTKPFTLEYLQKAINFSGQTSGVYIQ